MNVITNKNILDFKDQLTSPKMGDKFQLDIHINNGQRLYNIESGLDLERSMVMELLENMLPKVKEY